MEKLNSNDLFILFLYENILASISKSNYKNNIFFDLNLNNFKLVLFLKDINLNKFNIHRILKDIFPFNKNMNFSIEEIIKINYDYKANIKVRYGSLRGDINIIFKNHINNFKETEYTYKPVFFKNNIIIKTYTTEELCVIYAYNFFWLDSNIKYLDIIYNLSKNLNLKEFKRVVAIFKNNYKIKVYKKHLKYLDAFYNKKVVKLFEKNHVNSDLSLIKLILTEFIK